MDVAVALPPRPSSHQVSPFNKGGRGRDGGAKLQLRRLFTGPLFCLSSAAPSPCPKGEGGDLWWRALGDDDVNSETTLSLSVYGQAEEKQLHSTSQDDDNVAILSRKADQDPTVLEPRSKPSSERERKGRGKRRSFETAARRRRQGGSILE